MQHSRFFNSEACIGTIEKISETETVGNGFEKKTVRISGEKHETYGAQQVLMECWGDNISLLDSFKEGDEVEFTFSANTRVGVSPKTKKPYAITALKLKSIVLAGATPEPEFDTDEEFVESDTEDLPF